MVADINENGGKQTADSMPGSIKFHKTNVAKQDDWNLLLEATQNAFGGVDCLVNNAGTTYPNKVSRSGFSNVRTIANSNSLADP